MFVALVNNVTMLIVLSFCHFLILQKFQNNTLRYKITSGFLFGLISVIGMMNAFVLDEGIIFDGRSMVVSIAGLFGGLVTALVAVVIAGLYRALAIGGEGAFMGIMVLITSAGLGALLYQVGKKYVVCSSYLFLFLFGFAVHTLMLLSVSLLPSPHAWIVFQSISLPVLALFPLGTVILGKLLYTQEISLQAVKDLRDSEERFRTALTESPDPIAIHNEHGKILLVNKVWEELSGYTHAETPTVDRWAELVYGVQKDALRNGVAALFELNQRVDEGEFEVRSKTGEMRIWHFSTAPLGRDKDGLRQVISIARDVTEQKRLSAELEESKRILFTAMEQSTAGIAIAHAPTGELKYVNRSGLLICGETDNEIVKGVSITEYVSRWQLVDLDGSPLKEDDVPLARAIRHGETGSRQFIIRRDAQNDRYVLANAAPVFNDKGDIIAGIVVFLDITERKQFEMQQEKLLTAIEQSMDIFVITDGNGNIEYVNRAFEKTTGYTKEEVYGRNPRILKSENHDSGFYANLWTTIGNGNTWIGNFVNKKKNGNLYHENAAISPVFNSSGQIVNYVAVKRDISHEIEMESKLQQSQKMESIGRLAGGIAHDFNNIITALLGYTELARLQADEKDPIQEDLEQIERSALRAASLTRQILAFSRKQILKLEVVDLNEMILNMDRMLRRMIGEDVEYVTLVHEGLWKVKSDTGQLEQVLTNLVVNARDAMPTGGQLTIETNNIVLDEEFARTHPDASSGEYVMLAVSDTGTGIKKEIVEKIFDPFFTTKETGRGTGLGLSTVHGIVKQSGGNILSTPKRVTVPPSRFTCPESFKKPIQT